MNTATTAALALQLLAGSATGAIAFDNITNAVLSSTTVQTVLPWQAEDSKLANGSALTITRVELLTRLSSRSPKPSFEGVLTMSVCLSAPLQGSLTQPGTILATASTARMWNAGSNELIAFDIAPLAVPSQNLWIIWQFSTPDGQGVLPAGDAPFVMQTETLPTIGTTTVSSGASPSSTGPWQLFQEVGHYRAIRITTVPVPATLAIVGLGGLSLSRRMRHRRI